MLLTKSQSCLLLIDVQEKLVPLIDEVAALILKWQWLLNLAKDLQIPQIVTEQYPQGLGLTIGPLQPLITNAQKFTKTEFSCCRAEGFNENLQRLNKTQVILIGIETHVCILQTAFDLFAAGLQVFVVVNGVGSRAVVDYNCALERLKQLGVSLVTAEMVFFEWIGQAGTEEFKILSKKYLK